MKRSIITLPPSLMRWLDMTWDIDWRGQGAGDFTSGVTRTVYAGFPRFVGRNQVFLHRDGIRQWRAIRAAAQGRRNIYRIRMFDPQAFSLTETGGVEGGSGTPFSEGQYFETGFGFVDNPFALAVGAHSAGAEEIRVDVSSCNDVAPKQGQIMSHNDWPFKVTWVQHVSGTVYDIGIQMPLRSAIADEDPVLMRGVGRFEATEEGMGNPAYGVDRVSRPTIQFTEVLAR